MKMNSMARMPKIMLLAVSMLSCFGAAQCSASAQLFNAVISTKLAPQKTASRSSFDSIKRLCSVNTVSSIFSAFKQRPLLYSIGAIGALSLASYLTYKTYQTVQNIRLDDALWNTRRFWLNTKSKLFGRPTFIGDPKPTQKLEDREKENAKDLEFVKRFNEENKNKIVDQPLEEQNHEEINNTSKLEENKNDLIKKEPLCFSVSSKENNQAFQVIDFSVQVSEEKPDNKKTKEEIRKKIVLDPKAYHLPPEEIFNLVNSPIKVAQSRTTDSLNSTPVKKHKKTNSFDSKNINKWKPTQKIKVKQDGNEKIIKLRNGWTALEASVYENDENDSASSSSISNENRNKKFPPCLTNNYASTNGNGSASFSNPINNDSIMDSTITEKPQPNKPTQSQEEALKKLEDLAKQQPLPNIDEDNGITLPQNSKIKPYFKNKQDDYWRFVEEAQNGAKHLNSDEKFEVSKEDLKKTENLFESKDGENGLNALKKQMKSENLEAFVSVQNKYLQTIREITSFFALCTFSPLARQDETCFEQGTFKIYDHDNKLWSLLNDYRNFIENSGLTTKMTYNGYVGANYYAYDRASTHKAFGDDVFGIDFRKSEIKDSMVNAPESDLFLGKFKHLLIGHRTVGGKHYVWIKPEDAGLSSVYSWVQHVEGVVVSKIRKFLPEKWVTYLGLKPDDVNENSKEHLPDNIKKLFASLFPNEKTKFTSIEEMYQFAQTQQNSAHAQQFIDILSTLYIDPAEITGKEIIIGEPQLLLADAYKEGPSSWEAGLFRRLEAVARATWACQQDFKNNVAKFKETAQDFINSVNNLTSDLEENKLDSLNELPDHGSYYKTVSQRLEDALKADKLQDAVVISLFTGENKESKNLNDSWVNL
ncbi:MAG: hypothetical protein UV38_C0001G0279 [candidate division TM6 bacterium GW2011_GWE2_42_60]|nr:MAG: hypothetical protein UV38_C0001G0279 [candidate division TM6 bacterium GW2011_GWE2_42_60]HBY05528.1 hypothetical protein [Candidatus Dependentiae bacterium]